MLEEVSMNGTKEEGRLESIKLDEARLKLFAPLPLFFFLLSRSSVQPKS